MSTLCLSISFKTSSMSTKSAKGEFIVSTKLLILFLDFNFLLEQATNSVDHIVLSQVVPALQSIALNQGSVPSTEDQLLRVLGSTNGAAAGAAAGGTAGGTKTANNAHLLVISELVVPDAHTSF